MTGRMPMAFASSTIVVESLALTYTAHWAWLMPTAAAALIAVGPPSSLLIMQQMFVAVASTSQKVVLSMSGEINEAAYDFASCSARRGAFSPTTPATPLSAPPSAADHPHMCSATRDLSMTSVSTHVAARIKSGPLSKAGKQALTRFVTTVLNEDILTSHLKSSIECVSGSRAEVWHPLNNLMKASSTDQMKGGLAGPMNAWLGLRILEVWWSCSMDGALYWLQRSAWSPR